MRADSNGATPPAWDEGERAIVYRLLSELFARELPAERLGALAEAAEGPAAAMAQDAALRPLFDRIRALGETPPAAERELTGAFAFLFLGAGGPQSAPPYESVFTSDSGRTCQAPAAEMARELAALDLHVEQAFPEPADHVAVELAVVAALIESGVPVERQSAFLKERLNSWLPLFAAACARSDRSGFYSAAAGAAANFVADDLDRLASVPAPAV